MWLYSRWNYEHRVVAKITYIINYHCTDILVLMKSSTQLIVLSWQPVIIVYKTYVYPFYINELTKNIYIDTVTFLSINVFSNICYVNNKIMIYFEMYHWHSKLKRTAVQYVGRHPFQVECICVPIRHNYVLRIAFIQRSFLNIIASHDPQKS